jgi:hypothetical protein
MTICRPQSETAPQGSRFCDRFRFDQCGRPEDGCEDEAEEAEEEDDDEDRPAELPLEEADPPQLLPLLLEPPLTPPE